MAVGRNQAHQDILARNRARMAYKVAQTVAQTPLRRSEGTTNTPFVIISPEQRQAAKEILAIERSPVRTDLTLICAYAKVWQPTWDAIEANADRFNGVRLVDVSGSPFAYWNLFTELWALGAPFVIIEHDIVIRCDIATKFSECSEPWCTFPYSYPHSPSSSRLSGSLGCTRFSADIMTTLPDLFTGTPRQWNDIDTFIGERFRASGFQPHIHGPAVGHRNRSGFSDTAMDAAMQSARIMAS